MQAMGKVELSEKLEDRVLKLIAQIDFLKKRNAELETQCQKLQQIADEQTQKASKAHSDLESYKMAAVLRGTTQTSSASADVEETKERIRLIVREIDKCIALLKQ